MSDFRPYQSDHLILLVGGNPLPNAVAGRLLIRPGGKITLVHSFDTCDLARRLELWLRQDESASVELVQLGDKGSAGESAPSVICEAIKSVVEPLDHIQSVGLHYTGGTKAMAVHAHRALSQLLRESNTRAVFSYLDSRNMRIVFDPSLQGGTASTVPIGMALQLPLSELLGLHGWDFDASKTERQPRHPDIASALARSHQSEEAAIAWRNWIRQFRRPDRPDKFRSRGDLASARVKFADHAGLREVGSALRSILNSQSDEFVFGELTDRLGFKQPEDAAKWLEGSWIETLVLYALTSLGSTASLHDPTMGIEPALSSGHDVMFELDVAAMRGYQLFAFSCGNICEGEPGGRALLKHKLFEALIRSQQVGGDEACIALVCRTDDTEAVKHEVYRDIRVPGRVQVFGRKDLVRLESRISNWIETQNTGGE